MSKENSDNSVLDSKEICSFTGGIVGGGNNKMDVFQLVLSKREIELLSNILANIDCLQSEELSRVEDFINTKPDIIDFRKSTNREKFYSPFVRISKKSLHHIR